MPYKLTSVGHGKYRVTSPHGVKAKGTTKEKAEAQMRLLRAEEHDPSFTPRRSNARLKKHTKSRKGGKKR